MAKRFVDIVFSADGSFEIEATGFTGASCVEFTAPIEAALGSVTRRVMKDDIGKKKQKVSPSRLSIT